MAGLVGGRVAQVSGAAGRIGRGTVAVLERAAPIPRRSCARFLPDGVVVRASYRRKFGTEPDLVCPATLNEKIQWRKLYDRDPMYTRCADKYRVREYYRRHREWQYKHIAPLILIEELLTDRAGGLPAEYRFFCFDGAPAFVEVVMGRFGPSLTVDYYDLEWAHISVTHHVYEHAHPIPRPERLGELVFLAEALSRGFSFVRVDLYLCDDRLCFGELTFTPCAGFLRFHPPEYDRIFGEPWNVGRDRREAPFDPAG